MYQKLSEIDFYIAFSSQINKYRYQSHERPSAYSILNEFVHLILTPLLFQLLKRIGLSADDLIAVKKLNCSH